MRKKRLPLFAALMTVAAVALALAASSAFAHDHGTDLNPAHVGANSTTFKVGDKCEQDRLEHGATGGQVLWHFILNQVDDINTGVLTTDFLTQNGGLPFDTNYVVQGNNIAWWVITDGNDTLQAAHTDATTDGGNLNLSHVCPGSKFEPELTTEASVEGAAQAGSDLSDTAFLTGGSTSPVMGGTVDFALYNLDDDPTCTGTPIFTDLLVPVTGDSNGEAEVTSAAYTVLEKGTYSWVASYSGDDNNEPAGPNACRETLETVLFDAAAPTVVTEIHLLTDGSDTDPVTVIVDPFEVALGSTVHDKGTVTGPAALGIPTGDVDFKFWNGDDCVTDDEDEAPPAQIGSTSNVVLDANGVAHPSANFGPLGAGSYFFTAHFNSGDENKWEDGDSLCEPLTVNKADTTSETTLVREDTDPDETFADGGHLPLGTSVHDTATVGDKVGDFDLTGKLTYHFYTGDDCDSDNEVGTGEEVDVDEDGVADDSSSTGPLGAGSYSFNAEYAGNNDYNASELSDCEPFVIDKADLGFRTDIHNSSHNIVTSVPNPSVVHDTATLSNVVTGFNPSLTDITFKFFTNGTCAGEVFTTPAQDTKESDLVARTVDSASLTSGSYSYKAHYAGDGNYNEADFDCEPLTVRATLGKTMGFWGNNNGQARICATAATCALGYALNTVDIGRGGVINTQAESLKVLPNTKNACGKGNPLIFTGAGAPTLTANCGLAAGITSDINTLASQTLALGYNILLVANYTGQSISGLGCSAYVPTAGLTGASTVNQAFTAAQALIENSRPGGTTTQAMVGAMNALLGCLNREV